MKLPSQLKTLFTIFYVLGALLFVEAGFMALCCLPSFIDGEPQYGLIMLKCALITAVVGFALWFPFHGKPIDVDKRAGFLIVTLIWIVFSLFGSFPLLISGGVNTYLDAFFETMSGFTATGSSIINDVESLPSSIGMWRIITQWIGGIGIIVILLSLISFVSGGGMALYSAEVSGITKTKVTPHIRQTSTILIRTYLILTIFYCCVYFLSGMEIFDAICYAFTTVATAGLSPHNSSAAGFSPLIQWEMSVFMIFSGTNLLLFYFLIKGQFDELKNNDELRTYLKIFIIAVILIFILNFPQNENISDGLRNSVFMTASLITSTGLINCDYINWSSASIFVLVMLMIGGAMSGSTSGGLKMVRMLLLFKNAKATISRGLHSNAFIPVTLNGRLVEQRTLFNIFEVFILYVSVLVVGFLILIATGVDGQEAFVSALGALGNMGPGYTPIGSEVGSGMGNFAHFTPVGKLTMSFLMLVGRLELVTVFSIFTKTFWRR